MLDHSIWMYINYSVQLLFLSLGVYYFIISLFSFIPRAEEDGDVEKRHSFALLVAAHDEQAVIANMVESLKNLNYPKDKYEIFVVADNCTDNTAEIAEKAGAKVYERTNYEQRGKGHALEWMFENIFAMKRKFDYVAIFDADNLVDPNFLIEMNKQTTKGYSAVQGYIDSKNPNDSWITYSYSISFWTINKLFQQSRFNLGFSCQLCGTGFVVHADLLREMGWGATCLTEDMEFTMRLALNDIKVAWANNARVYDEKPLTFTQSWKQRTRWMQGHTDVAIRFTWPLIGKSIHEWNFIPLDCALYLLQPLRIITMGVVTAMAWVNVAYPDSDLVIWGFLPNYVWNVIVFMQFAWGPIVLFVEGKFTKRTVLGYMGYIVYSLTWVPIAIIGIAKRNQKEWFHTQHTRTISIREVN
ncbi:MAG: glycosyltransferase [Clostridiales bacterium]|jgi:cellulose synthase/poly-beta-1,6-N-acetylglucosamine synthase-like glycosyltransferase|nr:glycosyltransferase [Clostridiales bacterium]